MLSILAFSVQHEVEKYGAYVAVASFLGLALLSILYFAQAREVRRLRDWAGRAPERDAELEARVTMQAEEARRTQGVRPVQPARVASTLSEDTQVTPPPVAAPTGNGHLTAPPLTVPMGPRPATAAALVAAAVEAAESGEEEESGTVVTAPAPEAEAPAAEAEAAAPATGEPGQPSEPVQPSERDEPSEPDEPSDEATGEEEAAAAGKNGNGTGDIAAIPRATPRPAPAPATPAARRPAAQPVRAAERSATVPPRRPPARPAARPAPAPESGGGHGRGILIGVVAGVVVLAVAALAITQLGGSDSPTPVPPNTTETPSSSGTSTSTAGSAGPARADTEVVILNGTTTDGLAAKAKSSLTTAGYTADKIPTDTGPNQATQQSTVYYAANRRRQALAVGRVLKIDRVAAVDDATQSLADNSSDPPVKTDVVVVLGADQTP
jgi:LytR cell envelope-related transcriptional attenuator